MKTLQIAAGVAITAGLAACVVLVRPATAAAQGKGAPDTAPQTQSQTQTQNQAQAGTGNDYQFVARPGDSLSILVRRAIQLYAADKKLTLSPAAAMYCETNVTQRLGSRWLEVSEVVNVPAGLLQQFADSSKSLTPQQISDWTVYANNADFAIDDIKPTKLPGSQGNQPQNRSNTPSPTPNPSAAASPSPTAAEKGKNSSNSTSSRWYWWLLAGIVLVAVYLLAGNRQNPGAGNRGGNTRRRP